MVGQARPRDRPARDNSSGLRILADVPGYPPTTLAGSEQGLHDVLRWLVGRGHEVHVATAGRVKPIHLNGVQVTPAGDRRALSTEYRWADLVVTQLGRRNPAIRLAARSNRPLVHFLHMGGADPSIVFGTPALVVFSAGWLSERFPWPGPSMVLPSPVFADDYRVESDRTSITLIGLSELKGAKTFFALAEHRPDLHFLGVRGSWGDQIVPDELPTNVEIIPTTPDIRSVYARTRVLLMPSANETRGRTALEAAASGIPTLAHPTSGLVEVLGPDGLYADRGDAGAWLRLVMELDSPERYEVEHRRALLTSARWDPEPDLEGFESRLRSIAGAGPVEPGTPDAPG